MKRFLKSILMLAFLLVFLPPSHAAESVVVSNPVLNYKADKAFVTITWTAAADGSLTATSINTKVFNLVGFYLYSIETDPGSTAPTDNYDITITDANALDICYSQALNRDTSDTEIAFCATTSKSYYVIRGNLMFNLTGNSVDSATGIAILTFLEN